MIICWPKNLVVTTFYALRLRIQERSSTFNFVLHPLSAAAGAACSMHVNHSGHFSAVDGRLLFPQSYCWFPSTDAKLKTMKEPIGH